MTITAILYYMFLWFLIIIFLAIFIILCLWMWTGIKAKVPFVTVPNSILGDIEKALDIKDNSVVYDLGCGDARVLSYLAKNNKNAKYIGIENGLFPAKLAKVLVWWNKRKGRGSVEILDQDFFMRDLKDATHIYVYLYPNVMDDLLPKFDRELSPGTRLVSTTFKFTSKKPTFEVDLHRKNYQLAKKLFVYDF